MVELCQKVIAVCKIYKLYNENGDRDNDGRNGGHRGDGKDTIMCCTPEITMPRRTAQTTGGRAITRDLRDAAATAKTSQRAGLGYLLGEVRGIAIGIAIEIEIEVETGSKIAIRIVHDKQ